MNSMKLKEVDVYQIDNFIFYSMCGCAISFILSPGTGVYIFTGISTLLVIFRCVKEMPNIPFKENIKPIFIFVMTLVPSIVFSYDTISSFKYFLRVVYMLLPFFYTLVFINKKNQIKILIACLLLAVVVTEASAVLQWLNGDFRARGFYHHPMHLAGLLMIVFPAICVFCIIYPEYIFVKFLAVLSFAALVFNGTRGAWLSIAILFPVFIKLLNMNKKMILKLLSISLLAITVFYVNPYLNVRVKSIFDPHMQSNSERILMWKSAFQMIKDHPVFGVGLSQYKDKYQNEYILPEARERELAHPHNIFFMIAAEAGLVGLIGLIWMFSNILYSSYRRWIIDKDPYALAFFMSTNSLLLQGLTEVNFISKFLTPLYFFVMTICLKNKIIEK